MTATLWFLLGLWAGCCAGFLLLACVSVARDSDLRAALNRLRGNARRIGSHGKTLTPAPKTPRERYLSAALIVAPSARDSLQM